MADFIRVTVPLVVISLLTCFIWNSLRPWTKPRSPESAEAAELFTDPRWSLVDPLEAAPPLRPFDPALVSLPLNYFFGLFLAKGRYLPTTEVRA